MKVNHSPLKKVIAAFLVLTVVFSCLSTGSFAEKANNSFYTAEADSGNISFDTAYPEIGKEMKVVVAKRKKETFLYKWFINNNQINNFTGSYTPVEDDLEKMITVKVYDMNAGYVGTKSVFLSKLPVVYIEVDSASDESKMKTPGVYDRFFPMVKGEEHPARITIQGNREFNDESVLYDGVSTIKVRGNSTAQKDKKPYKIKLDKKTDLLGMGKSKHWVLLSNPSDLSNLRNDISYNTAAGMGVCAMDTQYVEVVLNGTSVGLYQLCEHVRVDSERVDILNWEDEAENAAKAIYKHKNNKADFKEDADKDALIDLMTESLDWVTTDTVTYKEKTYTVSDYYKIPDVNGGYLLKVDNCVDAGEHGYKAPDGKIYQVDTPDYGMIKGTGLEAYITEYFDSFVSAAVSKDFCTDYNGRQMRYTDFIDIESFAKGFLLNELFQNEDFGHRSTYMYKNTDGKLTYGPIWDMDYAVNKAARIVIMNRFPWIEGISSDPVMINAIRNVYWEYRYTLLQSLIEQDGRIDTTYNKIKEAAGHNDELWGTSYSNEEYKDEYRQRVQYKLQWLDTTFASLESAMKTIAQGYSRSTSVRLSVSGSVLNIKCSDNSAYANVYLNGTLIDTVTDTSDTSVEFDNSGDYVINVVTYDSGNNALNGNYYSNNKYVKSLTVTAKPAKLSYSVNESLDLSGLVLTATYNDGITETVSPDAAFTYTKDALSTQDFVFGKVTGTAGQRYVVLRYKTAMAEFPITVAPYEDYDKVIDYIQKIPAVKNGDYVHNPDFLQTICEAKAAYNELSEGAKAKVTNAQLLDDAFEALYPATVRDSQDNVIPDESRQHALGFYTTGIKRLDSTNKLVIVIKKSAKYGAPTRLVIGYSNTTSVSTYYPSSADIFSITDLGDFVVWTISFNCTRTRTEYLTLKASFGSRYQVSTDTVCTVMQEQITTPARNINSVRYSIADPADYECSFSFASCPSKKCKVAISEKKVNIFTSDTYIADTSLTFTAPGFHSLEYLYATGSTWKTYRVFNLYIPSGIITAGTPCTFCFNCRSDVQAVKMVENGNVIAGSANVNKVSATFADAGVHNVDILYETDGKWFYDSTLNISVRDAVETNKVFSEIVEGNEVTVITDENVESVSYASDSDFVRLTASALSNGYKVWTGTLNSSDNYQLIINEVDNVSLNYSGKIMVVGDTLSLVAAVSPENVTDKAVKWISSDSNIASVDENGTVTAVSEGTAVITCRAGRSDLCSPCAECVVRVFSVHNSEIRSVTYTQSASTEKAFTATVNGRPTMVQFIYPDGSTAAVIRGSDAVVITHYNAEGEEVNDTARDLAYEKWEFSLSGTFATGNVSVRSRYVNVEKQTVEWECEKDNPGIYSLELKAPGE